MDIEKEYVKLGFLYQTGELNKPKDIEMFLWLLSLRMGLSKVILDAIQLMDPKNVDEGVALVLAGAKLMHMLKALSNIQIIKITPNTIIPQWLN